MLAEKFFLLLETLKSRIDADSQRVVTTSRHVPMELPNDKQRPRRAIAQQKSRRVASAGSRLLQPV